MDRLNILVLHRLGDPRTASSFLEKHVYVLRNYFPDHNYVYHDVDLPLPEHVQETDFHAIILDVTLLCARWGAKLDFDRIRRDYAFVRDAPAVKIAFPQDEYDCSGILDDWMCDWQVDIVYSVIPTDWDVLYPRFSSVGEIRLGYTGYIEEPMIDMPRKPFAGREIDIGYRARKLLPYFGRIGEVKWSIGKAVAERAVGCGLNTDIVLGQSGFFNGSAWFDFISNCKFMLGSNSGSSLIDPQGEIQRQVKAYMRRHPHASFEEVEQACFPGLDGRYSLTAISPRVLEAGLLDSCQILVEGSYSGVIAPWEHYIPIKEDASDFDEAYEAMGDGPLVARLIRQCREALLDCQQLRASNISRTVIDTIRERASGKGLGSVNTDISDVLQRYYGEMRPKYKRLWRRKAVIRRVAESLIEHPALFHYAREARNRLRSWRARMR